MKTVQMALDDELLSAVDLAAGKGQETRSAFIRIAL
ncbi:ribbon-helix-helix protein, CopG family [Deinococcus psychrotolerans]|uniref:Ribbon-helix-helix protein, CopG family n=1 Tax=Deinococcus psychrotolerans TaxID=2489213 RepID=A0A3G8YLY4_9DEIO|nr:ribbon-helix-helix protein, CopG family [Deinococcus psychrotolerans]AZI42641.1 ribbon-helix-helix protein, CopG family [Deinococcus psychrotolerans]